MKTINLEVGKKYKTRDGKGPIGVVATHNDSGFYEFAGDVRPYFDYSKNGRLYDGKISEHDLVAEWLEPEAKAPEPQPVSNATMVGEAAPNSAQSEDVEPRPGETLQSITREMIGIELIKAGYERAGIYMIKGV